MSTIEPEESQVESERSSSYGGYGFGRAEDRFRRELGEESPNTIERDAA